MRVLGVSCDFHDAAAAVVVDGEIVAAAEGERFTRRKHDPDLPVEAIVACLATAGIEADDLDAIVFHEKPLVALGRVLATRQRRGPAAVGQFVRETPVLLRRNLLVAYRIEKAMRSMGVRRPPRLAFSEHHLSHAAAAFYPSPFTSAAVLTVDGVGEWATSTIGAGSHHRLELLDEQRFPNSLGLLYSLITIWTGFEANDGEYKVMGLAPYGRPTYREAIESIAEMGDDGALRIDGKRVGWWSTPPRRLRRLHELFGGPPREPGSPLTERDLDLARSVQDLVEDAVLRMARHAFERTGESRLCLAGGVALNCVANGRLLREGPFEEIWVQPAAGDAGSAVGAALWYHHQVNGAPRPVRSPSSSSTGPDPMAAPLDGMSGAALGPAVDGTEVVAWLEASGVEHQRFDDATELVEVVAGAIAGGAVVGWFEGRMEFGPRALGHRSILADPRSPTVQRDLNLRVKGRESFRPFAPAVLAESASDWFDIDRPSPYMLFTFPVHRDRWVEVVDEPEDPLERVRAVRSTIPACTHVDRSARVQTVHRELSPRFHSLIQAFDELTGCPVLLNTSFNVAGEPIVATPEQALDCARRAHLDVLVVEDCVVWLTTATDHLPVAHAAAREGGSADLDQDLGVTR